MRRALGIALSLALAGCYSKITAHDGNFTVAYDASVQIENFVKPLAPGGRLALNAFPNGGPTGDEKLPIVRATSSRPEVLRVVAASGTQVTIEGVAPGVADVVITVRKGDQEVSDTMFFHVATAATHRLEHQCTDERSAAYVRGSRVIVTHALATADGRPIIGAGYVPAKSEPADVLDLVAQPQAGGVYVYNAKKTGETRLRSTVDGSELSFRIVDAKDITTARLDGPDRVLAGEREYAAAWLELGDTPVCSQNALTRARSLTPEICTVSARLEDSLDDSNRAQLAEIEGLKFGTCELEVTLPELAGGKGIVLRHSLKVGRADYPGERSALAYVRDAATWTGLGVCFFVSRLAALGAFFFWLKPRRAQRRE